MLNVQIELNTIFLTDFDWSARASQVYSQNLIFESMSNFSPKVDFS